MALPHPRAAANVLAQGINSINSLNKQVLNAFTNAQVSMLQSLAEAAPNLPSFTTGQRRGSMSVSFPKLEQIFSAVPNAVSQAMPSTGATKGTSRARLMRPSGKTAMF